MKLLIASSNPHKAKEFSEILYPLEIIPAPKTIDVIEDGTTFTENAHKKAKSYFDKYKCPIIADDSGLIVESLPNELGLFSARFGEIGMDYTQKCELLLKKMNGIAERTAYFISSICVIFSELETYFFEGRIDGQIGHQLKGHKGFGFDPIFIPNEMPEYSLAEIPEWKNENSHRAKSCEKLKNFLKYRLSK